MAARSNLGRLVGRYGTADILAAWANKGDDPVEGRMPTYYAGDTIKVTFVFQGAPGIRSVTAAFSHEEEPDGIDLRGMRPRNKRPPKAGKATGRWNLRRMFSPKMPQASMYVK